MASLRSFLKRTSNSYHTSTTPFTINRHFTSSLLPTWLLALLRLTISLYAFIVLFYAIGWRSGIGETDEVEQSFSYFTVLGYWGLAFYFAFAGAQTVSVVVRGNGQAWLTTWPSAFRWAFGVYYATVTVFPFVVTAVFWAVLAANAFESQFSTFTNISEHALNSVFAFLEILLPGSEPHAWIHLPLLVVILACYLGLAYLTHATEGIYVYDFLDPEKNGRGAVAGYCFAILAATIVVFVVVRYLQLLRRWITEHRREKKMTRQGEDSALEMGLGENATNQTEKPHGSEKTSNNEQKSKTETSASELRHSKESMAKGFNA